MPLMRPIIHHPKPGGGVSVVLVILVAILVVEFNPLEAKDHRQPELNQKGNLCIARFETATRDPLYYTCPRAGDSEKKSYCCFLDKCCDYKEVQQETEKQFKVRQSSNYGYYAKGAIGSALKVLLWIVFLVILVIVGCCCLTFFLCRKKKMFQGGIFSSPLPAQPPGPSPYAPPANPYMAYQWPPETAPAAPPPAYPAPTYPAPSYPPYPSAPAGAAQPPFNPNFK